MRLASTLMLAALGAAGLGGCLDWQAAYDSAARKECRQIDVDDRSGCLGQVERNSSERRAESRRERGES